MKKLIILILLAIPGLVSAFRPGEPTDFSKKLSQTAIERTQHKYRSPESTQHTIIVQKKRYLTVLGEIALPNEASVSFHEKFGFSKVAHFREVGFKFNQWIDVGYWQSIL